MIAHEEVIQISKHYNLNINQSSTIEKYATQQKKVGKLLELYQKFVHDLDITLEKNVDDDDLALLENISELEEYEFINIGWPKGDLVETYKKIKEIEENEIE
jgi:hypothetical protein